MSTKIPIFLRDALAVGGMLILYYLIDRSFRLVAFLPEDSYYSPFLIGEIFHNGYRLAPSWFLIFFTFLVVALIFISMKYQGVRDRMAALSHPWSVFEDGQIIRLLLIPAAILIVWQAATFDLNLFFNQPYIADRLLLITFTVLLFWRPVFVFPFLLQCMAIFGQIDYPLGINPAISEPNFFLRIWALFGAFFIMYVLFGTKKTVYFIFLLCCLLASMYWGSGLGKFRLRWFTHPYIHWLMIGAYSNGWLAFLEPATLVSVMEKFSFFTIPLMIFTLFVEWGCLFFLWRRGLFKIFLIAFMLFHFGIFLTSGMLFWKWIVFEGVLLWFFIRYKDLPAFAIFSGSYAILSIFIIGGSIYWFSPRDLSWYDTPLAHTYQIEVTGVSGETYSIPSNKFNPYGEIFILGAFDFLNPDPQLTGIWDITSNRKTAEALVNVKTEEEIYALEAELGRIRYDSTQCAKFEMLITQFFTHWNERGTKRTWLSHIQPPFHLWNAVRGKPYRGQEPVTKVRVYQKTSFYDGNEYKDIRNRLMRGYEIPLPK